MTQLDSRRPTSSVAPQLKAFLWIETFLFLLCFAAEVFCKFVLHLNDPYTYPLKTRNQTHWDFTIFGGQFQHFHRPEFLINSGFTYPAPVAVAYEVFYSYHAHPLRFFLSFILVSVLVSGLLLGKALRRRGLSSIDAGIFIVASLLLSFPLWFELKQSNIEICVWVLVTFGVWAFCKGNGYTAAICFGIAGSMKIFPFVYIGLLLSGRKYRETACAAFAAVLVMLTSLWLVGPNIFHTWRVLARSIAYYRIEFILHFRSEEIGFDHTLFGLYKRFGFGHPLPQPEQLGHILNIYIAVAAASGLALYFLKIRHLPLINQVLSLAIASILLPPISYEYTLMHLYVPWGMLVLLSQDQWKVRRTVNGLTASFVCLAILMATESEFFRHGIRFGGQIKAVVLVVLMYIAIKYPFEAVTSPKNEVAALA